MKDKFQEQKTVLTSLKHEISLLHQQIDYLLRNEKALGLLDLDVLMNRTHTIYDQLCSIDLGDSDDREVEVAPEMLNALFGLDEAEEKEQEVSPEVVEPEPETMELASTMEPEPEPETAPETREEIAFDFNMTAEDPEVVEPEPEIVEPEPETMEPEREPEPAMELTPESQPEPETLSEKREEIAFDFNMTAEDPDVVEPEPEIVEPEPETMEPEPAPELEEEPAPAETDYGFIFKMEPIEPIEAPAPEAEAEPVVVERSEPVEEPKPVVEPEPVAPEPFATVEEPIEAVPSTPIIETLEEPVRPVVASSTSSQTYTTGDQIELEIPHFDFPAFHDDTPETDTEPESPEEPEEPEPESEEPEEREEIAFDFNLTAEDPEVVEFEPELESEPKWEPELAMEPKPETTTPEPEPEPKLKLEPEPTPEWEPEPENPHSEWFHQPEAPQTPSHPEEHPYPEAPEVIEEPEPFPYEPVVFGNMADPDDLGFEFETHETHESYEPLGEKLHVQNLKNAIGINDKFLLVNELFGGSMEKYNRSIENLDDLPTLNGALIYMNELRIELQWNSNNEAYKKLLELVHRKFED